jgi:hypothetical protein
VHRTTEFDAQGLDPAAAEAGGTNEQGVIAVLTRSATQARAGRAGWPTEWQQVFTLSDVLLELTPAAAERLERDLVSLLASYPQLDAGRGPRPGAWSVSTRFQIVPVAPAGAGAADQDAVTTRASTGASTRETASR